MRQTKSYFKWVVTGILSLSCVMPLSSAVAADKVVVIPLFRSSSAAGTEIPTVTSAGQVWMDRNLGAFRVAQSVDDYQAYGWLYQWGRLADGHEVRSSHITSTPSNNDVPGHGNFITSNSYPYDWKSSQNDNLWQGVSGTNNPCPAGFRLPTETELETERLSWSSNDSAGAYGSPLKLVVAGDRGLSDGAIYNTGGDGYCWSSTVAVDGINSRYLFFIGSYAGFGSGSRAYGFSARCLKD